MRSPRQDALKRRLAWGCRRGMLELDLLLTELAPQLQRMDAAELASARSLLELSDQQLWDLLIAKTATPEPAYAGLVAKLRQQYPSKAV